MAGATWPGICPSGCSVVSGVAVVIIIPFTKHGSQEGIQGPRQFRKVGCGLLHIVSMSGCGWVVTHKDMTLEGFPKVKGMKNHSPISKT